ncbi:hypothetical protein B0H14DRAFT_3490729 [Mycena olivaceomarginata]|nr:hypothetical protein B0H14DRAFT_3490729 [Mycena olivaceomarginata]
MVLEQEDINISMQWRFLGFGRDAREHHPGAQLQRAEWLAEGRISNDRKPQKELGVWEYTMKMELPHSATYGAYQPQRVPPLLRPFPIPNCALCSVPKTIPHFLLVCPTYRRQRLALIFRLGAAQLTMKRLLATKSDHKPVLAYVRLPHYTL